MSTETDVRPAPVTTPGAGRVVDLRDHPAPATTPEAGRVVDLRDHPAPAAPVPARRARLARLQALDVQQAALLHARVSGRRRTPRLPG